MSSKESKSVTRIVQAIRSGNGWTFKQAAAEVYRRYAGQLLPVVRREMTQRLRTRVDPEEVVNATLHSFYRRQRSGEYDVPNREALWKLLVSIAHNKALNQAKFHRRQKRDYLSEKPLAAGPVDESPQPLPAKNVGDGASPIDLLIAEEELEKLITGVPEHLRAVALLMLAGHDTADMAKQFGCSCRTIERRIQELGKLLCKKSDHSGRKAT